MCEQSFSCVQLCNPVDCSLPGSSIHGILQARILDWVAVLSSRGSSQVSDQTCIFCSSCTAGRFFISEPSGKLWEVKWALGNTTMNKASGGDGILAELFQILKMMLLKCCIQYVSKFWKLNSGHKTGKCQVSFQSQRRAMLKNVQTIIQLCSFHMPARLWSKSSKLGFSTMWTENL